jgi:uncharacterized lipoprotein NlpE involved in copper resistance
MPPCDPNAPHAVMLNLGSAGTVPAEVIVAMVVDDLDGSREPFTQAALWSPNEDGWSTVIIPVAGTPAKVLTLSIIEVLPGQEHIF